MSKKVAKQPKVSLQQQLWHQSLGELDAEIAANPNLTEAEKHFLLEEMDWLSDEEWQPITCTGELLSETVIRGRGER